MASVNTPHGPLRASSEPINVNFRLSRIVPASRLIALPPLLGGKADWPPMLGKYRYSVPWNCQAGSTWACAIGAVSAISALTLAQRIDGFISFSCRWGSGGPPRADH